MNVSLTLTVSLVSDVFDLRVGKFTNIIRCLINTVPVVGGGRVEFVEVELFSVPLAGNHLNFVS